MTRGWLGSRADPRASWLGSRASTSDARVPGLRQREWAGHLGLALGLLVPATAVAQDAAPLPPSATAWSDLAPRPGESSQRRERALEQSLEALLTTLPGVTRAKARLALPDPALTPLDQPLPAGQLTVLVTSASPQTPRAQDLNELLAPTLKTLGNVQLQVVHSLASQAPIAPLAAVPNAETGPLRLALAVSLSANVLLATLVLWRARQRSL